MIVTIIGETSIQIQIDNRLYSAEVIHKCFYWYRDKYAIEINTGQDSFIITISDPKIEWNIESMIRKIKADLIDFKTREIITNETMNIREMLIAKAFAHNDEFDEYPPGNVDDSIGV